MLIESTEYLSNAAITSSSTGITCRHISGKGTTAVCKKTLTFPRTLCLLQKHELLRTLCGDLACSQDKETQAIPAFMNRGVKHTEALSHSSGLKDTQRRLAECRAHNHSFCMERAAKVAVSPA